VHHRHGKIQEDQWHDQEGELEVEHHAPPHPPTARVFFFSAPKFRTEILDAIGGERGGDSRERSDHFSVRPRAAKGGGGV
jgi:hypothetical protein